jgi:hypothetical protein
MKTAAIIRASIAAAILLTAVGAAAPAAAAGRSLPAGDTLYTIGCDAEPTLALYTVDAATANAALVGDGSGIPGDCAYDPAYDFSTGVSYVLVYNDGYSSIATIDVTTGDIGTPVPATYEGDEFYLDSLTITKSGEAFATLSDQLYSVDLGTGAATYLGDVPGITQAIYGLATNPVNGLIYGIQEGGEIFTIDPAALTATVVGTFTNEKVAATWGLDIDAAGVLWIVTDQDADGVEFNVPGLWSAETSDVAGTAMESGWIRDGGTEYFYTFTALITHAPALAATGLDATPLLAGAAVLGLAGIMLVVTRRRTVTG